MLPGHPSTVCVGTVLASIRNCKLCTVYHLLSVKTRRHRAWPSPKHADVLGALRCDVNHRLCKSDQQLVCVFSVSSQPLDWAETMKLTWPWGMFIIFAFKKWRLWPHVRQKVQPCAPDDLSRYASAAATSSISSGGPVPLAAEHGHDITWRAQDDEVALDPRTSSLWFHQLC